MLIKITAFLNHMGSRTPCSFQKVIGIENKSGISSYCRFIRPFIDFIRYFLYPLILTTNISNNVDHILTTVNLKHITHREGVNGSKSKTAEKWMTWITREFRAKSMTGILRYSLIQFLSKQGWALRIRLCELWESYYPKDNCPYKSFKLIRWSKNLSQSVSTEQESPATPNPYVFLLFSIINLGLYRLYRYSLWTRATQRTRKAIFVSILQEVLEPEIY